MSENYVGQIIPFAFSFAPQGFAFCDGRTLPVTQNQALYSLIGRYFSAGLSDPNSFLLPDMRGRSPVAVDQTSRDYQLGYKIGSEGVALTAAHMPQHSHLASAVAVVAEKAGNTPGKNRNFAKSAVNLYGQIPNPVNPTVVTLNAGTVGNQGGGAAHNNMQPFLAINYCIAMVGLYPPRP